MLATRQLTRCIFSSGHHVKSSNQVLILSKYLSSKTDPPPNPKRIYYGSLTPQIRAVKVFSLSTSIAGLFAQPILIEQTTKMGGTTGVLIAVCGFVGFFTFVTPMLLHLITKKYVTEIEYDPATQEYMATVISFLLRKKQITFKLEDVKVPEVPGMFTSFLVNKSSTALFVEPGHFSDPEHYVKMMGFDKPMDFKLEFTENSEPKDKQK